MFDTERAWNVGTGLVFVAMGALWFSGTLKTDPGLGRGFAHDLGNIIAFYWMPTTLLLGGLATVFWNLFHSRKNGNSG